MEEQRREGGGAEERTHAREDGGRREGIDGGGDAGKGKRPSRNDAEGSALTMAQEGAGSEEQAGPTNQSVTCPPPWIFEHDESSLTDSPTPGNSPRTAHAASEPPQEPLPSWTNVCSSTSKL